MREEAAAIPPHLAPREGELLLFPENSLLERLSRIRPATVLAVFLPLSLLAFWTGLARGAQPFESAALFVAGVFFWTGFEYLLHRFLFHFAPRSAHQFRLQFLMHGVHHQYPHDRDRLVMPLPVSIPLAVLLFALFHLLLAERSWCFYSGFVAGYIGYDMMHYAIHHARGFTSTPLRRIRQHHLAHHFRDTRRGFGVSSPIWDWVFRT